jgi:hypothetical protein
VRDGVFKAVKRIGGAYKSAKVRSSDKFKGEIKGAATITIWKRFGSVGIRAAHGDLSLPQPSEIKMYVARHADHRDATLRTNNGECFGDAAFTADTINNVVGTARESNDVAITDRKRTGDATNLSGNVIGSDDVIGAELASKFLLVGMLRHGDDRALAAESAKSSDGEKAKSPRTKNNNGVALGNIGSKCAVYRACSGFNHDGCFI